MYCKQFTDHCLFNRSDIRSFIMYSHLARRQHDVSFFNSTSPSYFPISFYPIFHKTMFNIQQKSNINRKKYQSFPALTHKTLINKYDPITIRPLIPSTLETIRKRTILMLITRYYRNKHFPSHREHSSSSIAKFLEFLE